MQRIQRVSLFFRILFQLSIIIIPTSLIFFWIKGPTPVPIFPNFGVFLNFIPKGIQIIHSLSPWEKFSGFLISMIPTSINLITLYFLLKLFRLYEQGEIFSINNVRYLRNIGYVLLIGELLAEPIYQALISGVLTWGNGHGHRFIQITMGGSNLGMILLAFFIILISWIMAEGCKLREEQQLTI